MILRGLMDRSLGGFVCIRGYAPLGELARVSYADMDYQRDLIKIHRDAVITFLDNKKNLFFPEVILSCLLDYDFTKQRALSGVQPLADVLSGTGFKSNTNGIKVSIRKMPFKGEVDTRTKNATMITTLDIPDNLRPLFRIDGNHRLSAADKKPEFKDIICPFCVILFDTGQEDKRNSKTIFHNINSKSIPLTPEENLKIILDDEVLFPDEALKDETTFGWPFLLARRTRASIEPSVVPALKSVLKYPRTVLVELFRLLIEKKAVTKSMARLPDFQSCLETIHDIYKKDDDLQKNECVGLFHTFMYFCLTDKKDARFKPFHQWVRGNHLTAMKTTDAHALIEIFERVHTAKKRTVFISMQFGNETEATYKTIKKTIEQINKECQPKIAIQPLRIDNLIKGHSYVITDEILAAIENSGFLIADLTYGNKNVYHEIGYLMGLNRARTNKQENFVLLVREQNVKQIEKDVGFNLKAVSQIRFKEMNELEDKLTITIKEYYGLT